MRESWKFVLDGFGIVIRLSFTAAEEEFGQACLAPSPLDLIIVEEDTYLMTCVLDHDRNEVTVGKCSVLWTRRC